MFKRKVAKEMKKDLLMTKKEKKCLTINIYQQKQMLHRKLQEFVSLLLLPVIDRYLSAIIQRRIKSLFHIAYHLTGGLHLKFFTELRKSIKKQNSLATYTMTKSNPTSPTTLRSASVEVGDGIRSHYHCNKPANLGLERKMSCSTSQLQQIRKPTQKSGG